LCLGQVLGVVYHPDAHCHVVTTEDLLGQHWLRVFEADNMNEVRPTWPCALFSRGSFSAPRSCM
jgi:hypothetical protein